MAIGLTGMIPHESSVLSLHFLLISGNYSLIETNFFNNGSNHDTDRTIKNSRAFAYQERAIGVLNLGPQVAEDLMTPIH